jgi:hypothetical protein
MLRIRGEVHVCHGQETLATRRGGRRLILNTSNRLHLLADKGLIHCVRLLRMALFILINFRLMLCAKIHACLPHLARLLVNLLVDRRLEFGTVTLGTSRVGNLLAVLA